MNYRHIYHAGSFADVFKHSLLFALLSHFHKKDKPFCYIDSHAGTGLYDLTLNAAQKTGEYKNGIGKLYQNQESLPIALQNYLNFVRTFDIDGKLHYYPGSPLFAHQFIREHDFMILNELHPVDHAQLKQNTWHFPQCALHQRDGHEFLPAMLPPKIKRGLILLDPPFEDREEFDRIITTLKKCLTKFPQGMYAIWYPIKDQTNLTFERKVRQMADDVLTLNFSVKDKNPESTKLQSTGVVIINPPWQFEQEARKISQALNRYL